MLIISACKKENQFSIAINFSKNAKLKQVLLYATIKDRDPISIIEQYEYDDFGRLIKVSDPMYENGEITGLIRYNLYEYNTLGQLIKIKNYHANSNYPTGFFNLKNYIYTYDIDGKKEKEVIEYSPNFFEYSLFKYESNLLIRIEKYTMADSLENYIVNEYDDMDRLSKETSFWKDHQATSYTVHQYINMLNIKSDVYSGSGLTHAREILKTYDQNDNLIILESNELSMLSSLMSHVLRYEYFDD